MALPNESRRAPGRGRRPEDAPRLTAVPSTRPTSTPQPETGPEPTPAPSRAGAGLPEALACAVLDPQTPPKTKPKAPAKPISEPEPEAPAVPQTPAPVPEQDQGAEPAGAEAATTELVEVESRSAAEAERAIRWLGVTYRPPDVWRERQPSLKEEWEFVMDGSHLPEQGVWRAAARGYAAPTIALIGALHLAVWILRSPARHATAWIVLALPVVTAAFML